MYLYSDDLTKLIVAIVLGGVIGIERELRDKAAGFRTMIFICVGSTLFTILSIKLSGQHDAARIAAQIVTGVGFLGAGAILHNKRRVVGLTTASAIWLMAAIGVAVGNGDVAFAAVTTLAMLIVLAIFPLVGNWIDAHREQRVYEIVCQADPEKLAQLEALFRECGLRLRRQRQSKAGGEMVCSWETYGTPRQHEKLVRAVLADDEIREARF